MSSPWRRVFLRLKCAHQGEMREIKKRGRCKNETMQTRTFEAYCYGTFNTSGCARHGLVSRDSGRVTDPSPEENVCTELVANSRDPQNLLKHARSQNLRLPTSHQRSRSDTLYLSIRQHHAFQISTNAALQKYQTVLLASHVDYALSTEKSSHDCQHSAPSAEIKSDLIPRSPAGPGASSTGHPPLSTLPLFRSTSNGRIAIVFTQRTERIVHHDAK